MSKTKDNDEQLLATQAFVTKQFTQSGTPKGSPADKDEVLEIHRFTTEPASVRVCTGVGRETNPLRSRRCP